MANQSSAIVQKLWNYCNVLRDDGVSYNDYVEQLTYLVFLKMVDEQAQLPPPVGKPSSIPKEYDWQSLRLKDGDALEIQYRHTLENLGKEKGLLGVIFRKSQNKIQDPAKLKRLVELINSETWIGLDIDVKGEIYEGLLQKNAEGDNGIYRREVPVIPRTVIREAIVNALMHRNYRIRQPVQIIRFSNRLEIRNPGHSLKPFDSLGEPGSIARNEKIAAVLHDVGIAETKGTGIRVMIDEMHKANLTIPLFESSPERDSFTVKLLVHHLLSQEDVQWLAQFKQCNLSNDHARALIVAREVGGISNLIYRSINRVDTLTASQQLRHLRGLGLLEQKGKSSATYYTLSSDILEKDLSSYLAAQDSSNLASNPTDNDLSSGLVSQDDSYLAGSSTDNKLYLNYLDQMPDDLRQAVESLGERAKPQEVNFVIIQLCQWQDLSSSELATILRRNQVYLRNKYLNPLITSGELEYVRQGNPSDPHQAYRANKRSKLM
ncbi:ATP-binding protein [Scytonema sp. PRP1]|uniref:ATP-binding protein n=1 Tax=Scytonema sp. PRP1 TaxID=3120513 RepID=UPI002FD10E05